MNTEELKRLAEAATPGPWEYEDHGRLTGIIWGTNDYAIARLAYDGQVSDEKVDATGSYIAAANPAAVLELIRQRDELMEALKDAREMVSDWAGYASPYFQEKHDIDGDLKKLDDAIARMEG